MIPLLVQAIPAIISANSSTAKASRSEAINPYDAGSNWIVYAGVGVAIVVVFIIILFIIFKKKK
jgi:hypothetical protein